MESDCLVKRFLKIRKIEGKEKEEEMEGTLRFD
jgi:hypothetical protein